MANVLLYYGDELGQYGFPEGHPFGCDRQGAFWQETRRQRLHDAATLRAPRLATREELERFHDTEYVDKVERMSQDGKGYLDYGDTPAFPGCYEAAAYVVGTALDGLERVMAGECRRSFQPIGGLHHARREAAAGFCVFSDLGVLIETLRARYGVRRIAYVDIDVHHGDGVFYAYEDDPDLIFADLHEDGNYLYPGTGHAHETGSGAARDTKLNIPMAPGSGDAQFLDAWAQAEAYLRRMKPEFFLFQCGADSVAGDPLAHLRYSPAAHAHAAKRLCALANETAQGRIMAFGGGGYHRGNLAKAWNGVLREMLDAE